MERIPGKPFFVFFLLHASLFCLSLSPASAFRGRGLRFRPNGQFKILQVSDMHYGYGAKSGCLNVPEEEEPFCSDLNTTAFLRRTIASERPDLIVFSGDNINGLCETMDAAKSMNLAFAPAIESRIPWVAILGNHDQESDMTREQLMRYIVRLPYTLSRVNPAGARYYIDGFGNHNLEVQGPFGSPFYFKSVLNLYFLDSGDNTHLPGFNYNYDWIKTSQQYWYEQTSKWLEAQYRRWPNPQKSAAPGLAYFHIPLPEFWSFNTSNASTGVRQEETGSAVVNSGFFTKLVERRDVKAVFVGHDHRNDFCGKLRDINLCYAGGFGYHAYGQVGWARRARVVLAQLEKSRHGRWGDVESITTWKRLDDKNHSVVDTQVLWSKHNRTTASDEKNFWIDCSKIKKTTP
ncbi:PREDICTED: probable inactive purple acid phosphatase 14 [Tarenaya hassleriana]|uniref:probable inactive purple acid phosphatase 14 n=1 Tax=Tarenaya hassleriana TaxID=28532 RepID=UPI00053C2AC8|nr:PREDICTED: probable inactive purple acid phosphatase 14 [Tarenaya hassleriana]